MNTDVNYVPALPAPDEPVADQFNIPPGPGGFDTWQVQEFASPWHDQKAQMLQSYALALTDSAPSLTVICPETPLWWLVCLQTYIDTAGDIITLTVQSGGESTSWRSDSPTAKETGRVQRFIMKAHRKEVVVTKTNTVVGTNSTVTGTVYAIGAGIDPTKVGLF